MSEISISRSDCGYYIVQNIDGFDKSSFVINYFWELIGLLLKYCWNIGLTKGQFTKEKVFFSKPWADRILNKYFDSPNLDTRAWKSLWKSIENCEKTSSHKGFSIEKKDELHITTPYFSSPFSNSDCIENLNLK